MTTSLSTVAVRSIGDWRGKDVLDSAGGKLGKFEDLYYDGDTDQPLFIAVKSGLVGKHVTLVPLDGATVGTDDVTVVYDKTKFKGAPSFDPDVELTAEDEASTFGHYGLNYQPGVAGARRLAKR